MFDEAMACCENVFGYSNCPLDNVCSSGIVTPGPTPSLTRKPSANDDDIGYSDPCMGKSQSECKARLCSWDTNQSGCVRLNAQNQSGPREEAPTSPCTGHNKKKCTKNPECEWDVSADSCGPFVESSPVSGDDIVNGSTTTSTTTITATAQSTNTKNCDEMKWHPKTITDRTCSNSPDYPSLWDKKTYTGQYLFNSFKQCCKRFYGGSCNQENVCELGVG